MLENEVVVVNFEEYSGDFKWDKRLHFPIPTAEYILNRTDIDINERHDTSTSAENTLVAIVRTAKNYMFKNKNRLDKLGTELYIATSIEVIYEVLEYIMEFVNIYYTSGSYLDLFNLGGKVSIPAIEYALNSTNLLPNYSTFSVFYKQFEGQF